MKIRVNSTSNRDYVTLKQLALLIEFAEKQKCEENVFFLCEVADARRLEEKGDSDKARAKWCEIVEKFSEDGSEYEINLSESKRRDVLKHTKDGGSWKGINYSSSRCEQEVIKLLRQSLLPLFFTSSQFKEYCVKVGKTNTAVRALNKAGLISKNVVMGHTPAGSEVTHEHTLAV
eukprot:CFRG1999T1